MIKNKCNYISGATAVPTDIIDKYLKLASAASFKVLLFILRNPDGAANAEQIAMCTGLAREDVEDCLAFWESNGVIAIDDKYDEAAVKEAVGNAKICAQPEECEPVKAKEVKKTIRALPVKKPTQREIALRLAEEEELQLICNEAQGILGTFGYDTQALIVMIYDFYGFPPEVIITLLQHQKCQGSTSSAAIKNRAEDWAKRGIDNLEAVEKELLELERVDHTYTVLKKAIGLDNKSAPPSIVKFLRLWVNDWGCSDELIVYALEESSRVFTDANKLLKKWANSGITTPEQAKEKQKKSLPKEVKKSYNTEKVGRSSVLDWAKKVADGEENV